MNDVWPPPRSYHTSTLVIHSDTSWKLFVIGGKGKIDLENEVYELKISLTGNTSRPTTPGEENVKKKSYELSKVSTLPDPRLTNARSSRPAMTLSAALP